MLSQWISLDICPLELAENVPLYGVGACYRGGISPETLTTEPPKGGAQRSFYPLCIEEANATKGEHQESWELGRSMWSEHTGNKKKIPFSCNVFPPLSTDKTSCHANWQNKKYLKDSDPFSQNRHKEGRFRWSRT